MPPRPHAAPPARQLSLRRPSAASRAAPVRQTDASAQPHEAHPRAPSVAPPGRANAAPSRPDLRRDCRARSERMPHCRPGAGPSAGVRKSCRRTCPSRRRGRSAHRAANPPRRAAGAPSPAFAARPAPDRHCQQPQVALRMSSADCLTAFLQEPAPRPTADTPRAPAAAPDHPPPSRRSATQPRGWSTPAARTSRLRAEPRSAVLPRRN